MVSRTVNASLESIAASLYYVVPELTLAVGIVLLVIVGLIKKDTIILAWIAATTFIVSIAYAVINWNFESDPVAVFGSMARVDLFSSYLKILIDLGALLTLCMPRRILNVKNSYHSEYYILLVAIVLGSHFLVMSQNLILVFLSLELVSISSYLLTGFSFSKKGTEGSLKYFMFGSVASAIMLYGFSILYGLTGTLHFASEQFVLALTKNATPLFFIASLMALAGFLYKLAAAPFHPWAPDVYEASPMPVVAFFSVVPKLAGIGILIKFILTVNLFGQSSYDWQIIVSGIAILTLTVGNFSALWQKTPKRLMAYSAIAQSGFLLVGVASFTPHGHQFMLFYASVYLLMNYAVFYYLDFFEKQGLDTIASFAGIFKKSLWPSVFLLIGLLALTGLPPTAGFTAKVLIFSSLWESYQLSNKPILLWLLVFGLLNTVVSLFYYVRIPYYAFIKNESQSGVTNNLTFQTFLGFVLVVAVLILFFMPGLLMGWINKINFVL